MRASTYPNWAVSVDLGTWVSGLAIFDRGRLVYGDEVRITRKNNGDSNARRMAVALLARVTSVYPPACSGRWCAEKMVDYRGKGARKRDLAHLRLVVRQLDDLLPCRMRLYRAQEWKGGVPKVVTALRAGRLLTRPERDVVATTWASKEVVDAVALGLYAIGRAGRGTRAR